MSGLSVNRVHLRYPNGGGIETGRLDFGAGQIIALLGPNGAGKSTLIKALVGAVRADVEGLSVAGQTLIDPRQRARNLAYLSQTRTGPALSSVRDIIALGRFPFGAQDPEQRVAAVIETLGLGPFADRPFGTLSGGEQARVLLGRALAVDAPVLLADEPTASLDPHYALRIMDTLRSEARRGRTVIVSVHDLSLAERYCDQALILAGGCIVGQGTVRETLNADILRDVFRVSRSPDGLTPLS
ncbi:ABC transporter [Algimonas arctica]|uniref:ABC transporter n=1 Tax=Algimonas arctica TaxID=1479486 RepID=A0A8J3CQ60_9PROT|nr:ABC transporter ATP-binding protein [Algimonas arctica]GHA85551.1 ABC transporter [Algimonas arctica]